MFLELFPRRVYYIVDFDLFPYLCVESIYERISLLYYESVSFHQLGLSQLQFVPEGIIRSVVSVTALIWII
jgi:hypothetical protein